MWHTHTAKLLEQIAKAQSLEMGQGDNIIYIYLIQVSLCRHVWCHIVPYQNKNATALNTYRLITLYITSFLILTIRHMHGVVTFLEATIIGQLIELHEGSFINVFDIYT